MRLILGGILALSCAPWLHAGCQQVTSLSRAQAIAAAVAHGPRVALAAADTMVAAAGLTVARAVPDPVLSASYTKSLPRYHLTADFPLDFLALRGTRVEAASASRAAAQYRFGFERAAIALDVDTTYTRAVAADAHVRLSAHNAVAADSVRRIAIARRNAGDASELDVQLATVSAGQAASGAAADSLTLAATLLDLQALLGMPGDRIVVALTDSLASPGGAAPGPAVAAEPLSVAGALASVESAALTVRLEHRSVFTLPSLTFGVEAGDPTGAEPGLLPTVGIAIPLPLFNRNRGSIAVAEAARQRADAELALARVESQTGVAQARRAEVAALTRVGRDSALITSADRVAAMSLAAYREGAAPLATVLEAQRSARDILAQYVDDVATASIASAILRLLTLTPPAGIAQ